MMLVVSQHARVVLRVVGFERVGGFLAFRCQRDLARAVLARVLGRVRAGLEARRLRERDERAAAPARVRHDELLGRPIAGEGRLARGQARRALGGDAGRRRGGERAVAVGRGAVRKHDSARGAGGRRAIGRACDRDGSAWLEHLGRPTGAAQRRRRAHLAAPRGGFAVGARRVEIEVRVRVDEIDAGHGAADRDFSSGIESADSVVRGRGRRNERGDKNEAATSRHLSSHSLSGTIVNSPSSTSLRSLS
jgi:hypothetical protein